ncbi:leucine-rich repeat, immunoglobulin-like domain and transmembrane domain-containing protein 3b [Sparus aurata]|uniref:Leucine-rich repeat, immunoglobulin-like and transmembrane domains 3b n=1 Tax=Sparus aurata TaxID=8175 RepID=A0A671X843_SPAAU|nr:leucine-rich repeat, immunoglobulin-like domain and transmembrane domain-containing protein 3 [Sparus aurata]XP_030248235.1 leucine-rich repeat, immunoglobulin-like domain and transmembrane domain-containing protein 3 [Sparus aurata]XP_030248236.1 leucine-rich repeat, immunoglobulin-like domain and transmembrane domain-containing protein 3 [Sparus aurata]XP_030248237.1 leucine-rich repeat, immunoglobulin-like domain and transmembrane domain-containing protein 3 [Sparus aurata]
MFLLLLVQILQSGLLAVRSCPSSCACSYGNSGIAELRPYRFVMVQCSDPGISAVPINVPADTVKLRLEKTLISRVPRAAFFNLSELRFLWLTYNSITSIHPSSFVNLKTLRELRLDGNFLTSFPWEGLRDMPRLQTLGLHNNRLSILPAHAALFLLNITYLDLSSNRLTILPAELLDLWFPLPGQQDGPVQRRILGLHDNPWLCDCQISMVMSLSMSVGSPVVLMDQLLICSRALGQSGVLLTQAELSRCMRPSVQPAATRVISPLGSNVILRCDATGYPTPTLTWIKTSAYADCCQDNILANSDQLPRNLESFLQESPRVGVRWSIITLNGLSYKDAGEYRCQARNMAGISEAPIKLKVVGVTRLSRLPKRKSQKTSTKSSSKQRKANQTTTTTNTASTKENQRLQNMIPPSINKTQTSSNVVPKLFPVDKRRKMNSSDVKKKTQTSIKPTPVPPENSATALSSETFV